MRMRMLLGTLLCLLGVATGLLLSGCNTMKIEDFVGQTPKLRLEQYFSGRTYAWGLFQDRFGKVRRQFQVTIDGHWDGDVLTLDERFLYNDGQREQRVWSIRRPQDDTYTGTAADVIGEARGHIAGNALNWQYQMQLPVDDKVWHVRFNDWMWLQPGGVLINKAKVSKWGFELGEVTLFFSKQPPLGETP